MSSFRQILVSILFLLSVTSIRCNDDANSTTSPTPTQTEEEFYTAADSASWAITSNRLSPILGTGKQSLYDDFIDGCDVAMFAYQNKKHLDRTKQEIHPTLNVPRCARDDEFRLRMNRDQPASVYNYTKMGYAKIRTPPALFKLIQDFWTKNKHKAEVEWKDINVYHNSWEAPPTIAYLNQIRSGGSSELQDMIWKEAKPILEEWTGQYLSPVSLYGIRSYHNGSILAPHVDRMPLVTSAISTWLCLNWISFRVSSVRCLIGIDAVVGYWIITFFCWTHTSSIHSAWLCVGLHENSSSSWSRRRRTMAIGGVWAWWEGDQCDHGARYDRCRVSSFFFGFLKQPLPSTRSSLRQFTVIFSDPVVAGDMVLYESHSVIHGR